MATVNACPIHKGDKDFPGPTFAALTLTGYIGKGTGEILLSPELATDKEVDEVVNHLIKEIEKAGKSAKRILARAKGRIK